MAYALAITIAAGVALLLLFAGAGLLVRRVAAEGGVGALRGLRFYPSPLLLLLLLPLAALLFWRIFPALLILPFIIPFFWGRRRFLTPFSFRGPRRQGRDGDRDTFDGPARPLDDE